MRGRSRAVADGWVLRCIGCASSFDSDPEGYACPHCGDLLELRSEGAPSRQELYGERGEGIWRFARALPFDDLTPVSLGEGSTPLVRVRHRVSTGGPREVYVKNEGQNPTGSFKDRGMTVSVSRAVQSGARLLVCASTGNTSASMSAYGTRADLGAAIVVPAGKVAAGKLAQASAYGARIIRVEGTFDDALRMTLSSTRGLPQLFIMNSVNPYRVEGQKTSAYEIFEQLGYRIPDYVLLPVGNAGNISAIWKGFKELASWGISKGLPRMIGVQASGASPIAEAFRTRTDVVTPVREPRTVASAIRIGNPASWKKALAAIRESGGMALTVKDDEIVKARLMLASREGIFVEPASAAPLAALAKIGGELERDAVVACVATGNGLKDQESIRTALEETPFVSGGESLARLLRRMMMVSPRRSTPT